LLYYCELDDDLICINYIICLFFAATVESISSSDWSYLSSSNSLSFSIININSSAFVELYLYKVASPDDEFVDVIASHHSVLDNDFIVSLPLDQSPNDQFYIEISSSLDSVSSQGLSTSKSELFHIKDRK